MPRNAAGHLGEVVRWLVAPVVAHRRALLALNVLYFGVAAVAAVYAFINPAVQAELTKLAGEAFSPTGTLGPLIQAYVAGDPVGAIALTFLVNLFLAARWCLRCRQQLACWRSSGEWCWP